jgi:uncharacterized protein (TIGR00730 family)
MLFSEIEQLGEGLAQDGHAVVYGGATPGCMGALARGVKRAQGKLIGVVPQMDFMDQIVEPKLDERHVVPSLSNRKEVMNSLADAFVVYPGGLGTLDEVFEALALKSIGTLRKPVVFYNFLGVWTPVIEAMGLLREQNLIRDPLNELFHVVDNVKDLREHLKNG